ncbi:DegQ family serine endoprotease [Microbaculum sp. FT89]|uniref:DegQ family serine endoprotease n=1 Tax=Microbaculum sp. FT89 TaxID=3447298 RepID=UPI003F53853B
MAVEQRSFPRKLGRRIGRGIGRLGAVALAATLIGTAAIGGIGDARAKGAPDSFADLSDSLIDAVVNISTTQRVSGSRGLPMPNVPEGSPFEEFFDEFFDRKGDNEEEDRPRRVNSLGSGFVISEDGIIVTNNHVIAKADEIVVNFNDGSKLPAELIGFDEKTDVAVLRVQPPEPLKAVTFGDSESLRVGDWVLAIGNPFGLGGTVTAGIVSARNRDINAGPYDSFIQTDASINRGNSGGPLFDMDGKVVGINTAIISPSGGSIGIGFAVPANLAKNVIGQLIEYGETRRGWLGVRIQTVTDDIAESLGMDAAMGALVAGVSEDGPAEDGGLETGDVILEFDGKPIDEMRELPRVVADTEIGKEVDVKVLRKGEEQILKVTVGRLEEGEKLAALEDAQDEAEPDGPKSTTVSALGLDLSDLNDELRERYQVDVSIAGAVVTEVDPSGPAAERQIRAGDVIVEVAQEKIASAEQVQDELGKLKDKGRKSALLLVANPAGELRFVVVPFED